MEGRARSVLDRLHQLDELILTAGTNGREADTAAAHHHSCNAMPTRRRDQLVPAHLAVEVCVDVDEPRREQVAVGIHRAAGTAIGAVGISGDASDKDEYAAITAVRSVGLLPHPEQPAANWRDAGL